MKLVIRKNFSIGFAIFLIVFLLQNPISKAIHILTYIDEIESIIFLFILFCSPWIRKKKLINKSQKKLVFTFILLIAVGLIGNRLSSYQNFMYISLDILVYSKLIINLFAANLIINSRKITKYEDTAWKVASIVSIILFALIIHETFVKTPIWPYLSDRYGVRSLRLFFTNQTYLAQIGVILLIIHYALGEHRYVSILFYIIDMLISVSTFRTKALGFVMVAAIIIFLIGKKKVLTKINIIFIGATLVITALAVGFDYLVYYYLAGNESSIRLKILVGGMYLARMYAPFGAGFGTYCSLGAKLNYSLAYDILGMRRMYLWDSIYDNFWASVLGQLGYLGCLIYVILIIQLIMLILQIRTVSTRKFWSGILLSAYLIIASLGESSFNAFYACPMGFFMGYLYNSVKMKEELDA